MKESEKELKQELVAKTLLVGGSFTDPCLASFISRSWIRNEGTHKGLDPSKPVDS